MKALLQTMLHALELIICVSISWLILNYFNLNNEQNLMVTAIVLNALAKFVRSEEKIPIDDYVNIE